MSQMDKVIYVPVLFWFCLCFLFFYFFIFSYFLGYFMYVFKMRLFFFNELINSCYNCYFFLELVLFFFFSFLKKNFYMIFFNFLKLNFINTLYLQMKKQLYL